MARYRIILANHHGPLRECLKRILGERPDLEVIGEVEDDSKLLNFLSLCKFTPQMVVLDPLIPYFQGIDTIRKIKTFHPEIKVLILSMHKDKEYLSRAIVSGAEGYLIKETVDKELLPAIETIMRGKLYVPPFP